MDNSLPRSSSGPLSPGSSSGARFGKLRSLDLFPKVNEDFFTRTASGGLVTLISATFMLLLFLGELRTFVQVRTVSELNVDTSRGETIQINLDITLPHMPCSVLSLDVMDVSGEEQLDVSHTVLKRRLEPDGREHVEPPTLAEVGHDEHVEALALAEDGSLVHAGSNASYCGACYGAETEGHPCCNSCAEVRDLYRSRGWGFNPQGVAQCKREGVAEQLELQRGEGCRVFGHFEVNKVAGNFHFAPGRSFQQGMLHVHDLVAFGQDAYFNMSHSIAKLSYGADFPGLVNPLDGAVAVQTEGHLMYQYFIKVVPTLYTSRGGRVLRTAQFSVTEHPKAVDLLSGRSLPGVFFFFDINPIQVAFAETKTSFLHFLTSVCAIVGGVFTVSGIVDSALYHGQRALKRKRELGKAF